MFKVTNKFKDVRKFRDKHLGKDILVSSGESVIVKKRIEENDVWKVEKVEKKSLKNKKEDVKK